MFATIERLLRWFHRRASSARHFGRAKLGKPELFAELDPLCERDWLHEFLADRERRWEA
jgi:hypothetical protein